MFRALLLKMRPYRAQVGWRDYHDHPYPHIEGAIHLAIGNASKMRKHIEDGQPWPRARVDLGGRSLRKYPGGILKQASTSDVYKPSDHSRFKKSINSVQVTGMRLQQLLSYCAAQLIHEGIMRVPGCLKE